MLLACYVYIAIAIGNLPTYYRIVNRKVLKTEFIPKIVMLSVLYSYTPLLDYSWLYSYL